MLRVSILALLPLALALALPAAERHAHTKDAASDAEEEPAVDPALLQALSFRQVGPHRGGRVTAITGVRERPFTLFMGASGGGVWRTTNAGGSWENVSDGDFGSSSIGALAVSEADPNVVYVGTGSACPRGNVQQGDGIYGSTDGGESWRHLGLADSGSIARIRIDPRDPERVWAAVLGRLFEPSAERGVYRSSDGGANWERVLHVSDRAGAVDLALDESNPRRLFAAIWRFERKPWTLVDGGEESGLYRSSDGGTTWERLEDGLPEAPLGRIGVAISPADPDRVWALVTAGDDEGGLFRSDDGGSSWRRVSGDRELQTRGWYYTHVVADPVDRNTVYVLNARAWRSIDGGLTFERFSTPHSDNHDLWIHPGDPKILAAANDGGATVSLDGGASWSTLLNQPTAEFYRLTVDERFPYRLYGAQQDNSTISVPAWSEGNQSPLQEWWIVPGGESGHVALHPDRPDVTYAGNYIGTLMRHDRSTGETRNAIPYPELADGVPPKELTYRFQWNAPTRISPHDPDTLYHASNVLHRSRDGGMSWQVISPDLTRDDPDKQSLPGGPIQHDDTGVEVYNTIFAFEESPHTAGELWAGSDDGRLHLSRDAGVSWTEVTPPDLPADTTINSLELSVHAPGRVLLAAHRYRLGDDRPFLFATDNWGASWRSLTDGGNGLPADHPTRVVREDPARRGLLYAGTEYGLFVSFDDGRRWQPLRNELPVVQVADLAVHRGDLVVATHGRSFWVLDDLSPLAELDPEVAAAPAHLFSPRPVPLVRSGGYDTDPAPDRKPSGALLYFAFAAPPAEPARLEILDREGLPVRRFELVVEASDSGEGGEEDDDLVTVKAGLNRLVWDFRTEEPELLDDAVMSLGYTGGTTVPPGEYTVRLVAGEAVAERQLELLPDPRRRETPLEAYHAGYELAERVRESLVEIHRAVSSIRSLRQQIGSLEERLEGAGWELDLEEEAVALTEELSSIEEELIQTRNEARQDPLNFPPKLDNQFSHLYGQIERARGRPTEGAYRRYDDLLELWQPQRDRLERLLEEGIAGLNRRLQEAEVPAILVPRPVAQTNEGDPP